MISQGELDMEVGARRISVQSQMYLNKHENVRMCMHAGGCVWEFTFATVCKPTYGVFVFVFSGLV